MRTQLRAAVFALIFLSGAGFAVAQTSPGSQQEKLNLSADKERMVTQGLASEPSDARKLGKKERATTGQAR
jgi:hypothetical protein